MSDMWSVPPGVDKKALPKRSQGWFKPALASALIIALGLGAGNLYVAMHRSTAVTTQDALAEFRAESADHPHDPRDPHRSARNGGERSTRSATTGGDSSRTATHESSRSDAGSHSTTVAAGQPRDTAGHTARQPAEEPTRTRPEAGVYTWQVDGYEDAPGVHRDLPKESHRIITYEGNGWVEHHIYSEQKEQWFHLSSSQQGVAVSEVRNRVVMGPVTVDKTVTYNPVAYATVFPLKVGQTWHGSWSGKTSGDYTGKTIDHGTMTIGGEDVEVWVTEVVMHMHGDVEGSVVTRSWVAPSLALVVKQYQDSKVDAGPGTYRSEWTGQVTSLHPQR
ncbi:MAG TPA: hypothetical protein VFK89_09175 [Actinomycetota bacterium]|nr:hypothetical protein [Actinomycetota bacterium]